jgi:hypothetical protein
LIEEDVAILSRSSSDPPHSVGGLDVVELIAGFTGRINFVEHHGFNAFFVMAHINAIYSPPGVGRILLVYLRVVSGLIMIRSSTRR